MDFLPLKDKAYTLGKRRAKMVGDKRGSKVNFLFSRRKKKREGMVIYINKYIYIYQRV